METTETKPVPQGAQISLEFGKSTSKNYDFAVQQAMKHPTYSESTVGKEVFHKVTVGFNEIDFLRSLLDIVGQWKSTKLYLNDRPILYNDVSQVLYCYSEREKAFNPKEYCFGREDAKTYNDNDLGCRHCGVNPYGYKGLAGLGEMQPDGTFKVDKDKFVYTVARNLENFLICPALNPKNIEQKLKSFPDQINPKRSKQWEYVTDYVDNKEIAVAVRKKHPDHGKGYVVKDYSESLTDEVSIKISDKPKSAAKTGCLLPLLGVILFTLMMAYFILK